MGYRNIWIYGLLMALCALIDAQDGINKVNDVPSEDYVDRGQDGSYRFGYKDQDAGGHYHTAAGSRDNIVSGKYGYRDPSTRRIVQTTYTAGGRGFRARGPDIARRMDLSQTKIPYQPPVPPNSPNYQPSYNAYFDPNEDPSYDFSFRSPVHSRGETADSRGNVNGAFSYVDDVGKRHDVQYEAGSGTGFNVKTAFPDSDPFPGVFYQGPNKPGSKPRGHSAIVRSNDGAYKFTASGPDQQRTEVSDAAGRVRGSYTYIDDKGVQRTVQYIAGPNIGYKVIRKGAGPVYSSVYPFARPEFVNPTLNDAPLPSFSTDSSTSIPTEFDQGLYGPVGTSGSQSGNPDLSPVGSPGDLGSQNDLFAEDPNLPTSSSSYFSNNPTTQAPTVPPSSTQNYQFNRRPIKPLYQQPFKPLTKNDPPGYPTTDSIYRPSSEQNPRNPFSYQDTKPSNNDDGNQIGFGGSYTGGSGSGNKNDGYYYPQPKSESPFSTDRFFNENGGGQDDNGYSGSHKNFHTTAVRAHVQSLDILPYGSKVPSPSDALEQSGKF